MHVQQMILSDLVEQVIAEWRLWRKLDREVQLQIIAILANLISRTICSENNTTKGEKDERY